MLHYQRQWLVRALGPTAVKALEQQVFKLVRLLEVLTLLLLVPIAFQADVWVMILERLGWKKPNSTGLACIMAALCSCICTRNIEWVPQFAFLQYENFRPPTEVFEILLRIDPNRPMSLLYHSVVCFAIYIFCVATTAAHAFMMLAKACISIPLVICTAALLTMIKHCRASDGSGRATAILLSQEGGAPLCLI